MKVGEEEREPSQLVSGMNAFGEVSDAFWGAGRSWIQRVQMTELRAWQRCYWGIILSSLNTYNQIQKRVISLNED